MDSPMVHLWKCQVSPQFLFNTYYQRIGSQPAHSSLFRLPRPMSLNLNLDPVCPNCGSHLQDVRKQILNCSLRGMEEMINNQVPKGLEISEITGIAVWIQKEPKQGDCFKALALFPAPVSIHMVRKMEVSHSIIATFSISVPSGYCFSTYIAVLLTLTADFRTLYGHFIFLLEKKM